VPTYTYVCDQCQTHFEAFASIQKKTAGWQPTCPQCGSAQTRQTFESVAVQVGGAHTHTHNASGSCCSARRG
jgi:putative FmdB family regulatory protein